MPLLDRYITKEMIGPFVFGIAAFSCILAGSTVLFNLVGDILRLGIPIDKALQLFLYRLPSIIVFTFPMSILLATILSFGRLSSDLEIIAFRASGISIYRLVVPVFIMGLFVSMLTIGFNEFIVPNANRSAEDVIQSVLQKEIPTIKKNINHTEYDSTGLPVRLINVLEMDGSLLKNITVAEFDKGVLSRIIRAESGKWLQSGGWEFYNGTMDYFPSNKRQLTMISFKKEFINMPINIKDFSNREKSIEEMNARELRNYIAVQSRNGQDVSADMIKFHMKFSVPFASLIFAILGASVGLRPHRSSSAIGLGISLIIIIIYYVLLSVGMGLSMTGVIPPIVGAWLPNILVGSTALFLLYKIAYQ